MHVSLMGVGKIFPGVTNNFPVRK